MLLRSLGGADAQAGRVQALKTPVLAAMAADSSAAIPAPALGAPRDDPAIPLAETTTSVAAPVFEEAVAPSSPGRTAAISISVLPDLSYAHARNSIAIVDEITVDYQGEELRGASVEVEAISKLGSLGGPEDRHRRSRRDHSDNAAQCRPRARSSTDVGD